METVVHVPPGHPETMKRDLGFVGAASSRDEFFGTVEMILYSGQELMKSGLGNRGLGSSAMNGRGPWWNSGA